MIRNLISAPRAWGLALALLGCRSHTALCEGTPCTTPAMSEGGGSPSEATSGGAPGSGGGSGESGCRRDTECQNGESCDGEERCLEGRCEPGAAVECRYGTACVEAPAARCEYEQPSPWLVALGAARVHGLPLAHIARGGELAPLATREAAPISGYERLFWSPDGKTALLRAVEDQLGSSLKLLRFGGGLPSAPLDLPDVPTWGGFWEAPEFSSDGTQLIVHDELTGSYLVDLGVAPEPTRRSDGGFSTAFEGKCAAEDTWLEADDDGLHYLATRVGAKVTRRELGPGSLTVSDDARWVARAFEPDFEDERPGGVWLYPCSKEARDFRYEDAVAAQFSPGSAHLVLELDAGGVRALALGTEGEPLQVWSESDVGSPRFTPDGDKMVLAALAEEGNESLRLVDFSSDGDVEARALSLPSGSSLAWLGNSSLLIWSAASADGRPQLWRQALAAETNAELVSGDVFADETVLHELPFLAGSVLVQSSASEGTTLSILEFDERLSERAPLTSFSNAVESVLSWNDGRGLVITTTDGLYDRDVWWLGVSADGPSTEPRKLFDDHIELSIQPWP